jgi:large subunit ribosomal protein L18
MADKQKMKQADRLRKKKRIRSKISGTGNRPRLLIFRSLKNTYAQLIDDSQDKTLTGVSTLSADIKGEVAKAKTKQDAAKLVGIQIAQKAKSMKIEEVVFDRGGYRYHGRVKAVAEGAREKGLKF